MLHVERGKEVFLQSLKGKERCVSKCHKREKERKTDVCPSITRERKTEKERIGNEETNQFKCDDWMIFATFPGCVFFAL